VVGLLVSATEDYCLFPPNVTPCANRPVIGIVTQIDRPGARPDRAEAWLRLCGCEEVFPVSAATGEGLWRIFDYLREPGDGLPWEEDHPQQTGT